MFKRLFLLLFFISSYGYSETQVTAPTPCTIPSCKYYGGVILVDPTTGAPYSASAGGGGGATSANQTNGTQQTKITNGATTADTVAGDSGNNSLLGGVARKTITYTGATTAQVIDMTGFSSISITTSSNSGTNTYEQSGDGVTYKGIYLSRAGNGGTLTVNASSALETNTGNISSRYFRITPSGTFSAVVTLSSANYGYSVAASSIQSGVWNVGSIPVATVASTNSPLNSTSTALEASRVVKASAGILYSIECYNSKITAQWVLIFNATSAPADGVTTNAVPIYCAATSNCTPITYGQYGKYFSTGMTWTNSSTVPTKTIGSADVFCDARYQ